MASNAADIPNRPLFRVSEVCEIARVQPYVLRSWEVEFPNLGVERSPGAARVYRREDVQRVLRIKHLLYAEGLTLAGARRRIEEEGGEASAPDQDLESLVGADVRERIALVKRGLRSILELLRDGQPGQSKAAGRDAGERGPKPEPAAASLFEAAGPPERPASRPRRRRRPKGSAAQETGDGP